MWTTAFVCHFQFLEECLTSVSAWTAETLYSEPGQSPPAPQWGSPINSLLLQHSRTLSVEFILEFLNDWVHNPTENFLE